jgi:alanine racemase
MVPAARAALDAGADGLGVCTLDEALTLRRSGITAPVLAWLLAPGLPLHEGVAAGVDLGAASLPQLDEMIEASRRAERPARLHLKVDTGLSRGGATVADWPNLLDAAAKAQAEGLVEVVGVWSHFAPRTCPVTHHRPAARGLPRGAGHGRAGRAAAALPPPGQLRRHADPPGHPLRPGPSRYRDLRALAGGRRAVRAASGDDRPGPGDADQAGPGRHRRLLRPHLHHRTGDHPPGASVRRRGAPARSTSALWPGGARGASPAGLHGPDRADCGDDPVAAGDVARFGVARNRSPSS